MDTLYFQVSRKQNKLYTFLALLVTRKRSEDADKDVIEMWFIIAL